MKKRKMSEQLGNCLASAKYDGFLSFLLHAGATTFFYFATNCADSAKPTQSEHYGSAFEYFRAGTYLPQAIVRISYAVTVTMLIIFD